MLPWVRKKRSRLPLADRSTCSAAVGAVEQHRVGAVLALDGVAAVARIPDERVVAGAEEREVVAAVAVDRVVAGAAARRLDALGAGDRVVSGAAVERQGDRLRCEMCRVEDVVAVEPVDGELIARLLVLDRNLRRQAGHGDTGGVSADVEVSLPLVALTITWSVCAVAGVAAECGGQVGVDGLDVGAGQVVDGDRVGAAERVEVDRLDAGGVHGDVALGAEEAQPVAVGRQVDLLGRRWRR